MNPFLTWLWFSACSSGEEKTLIDEIRAAHLGGTDFFSAGEADALKADERFLSEAQHKIIDAFRGALADDDVDAAESEKLTSLGVTREELEKYDWHYAWTKAFTPELAPGYFGPATGYGYEERTQILKTIATLDVAKLPYETRYRLILILEEQIIARYQSGPDQAVEAVKLYARLDAGRQTPAAFREILSVRDSELWNSEKSVYAELQKAVLNYYATNAPEDAPEILAAFIKTRTTASDSLNQAWTLYLDRVSDDAALGLVGEIYMSKEPGAGLPLHRPAIPAKRRPALFRRALELTANGPADASYRKMGNWSALFKFVIFAVGEWVTKETFAEYENDLLTAWLKNADSEINDAAHAKLREFGGDATAQAVLEALNAGEVSDGKKSQAFALIAKSAREEHWKFLVTAALSPQSETETAVYRALAQDRDALAKIPAAILEPMWQRAESRLVEAPAKDLREAALALVALSARPESLPPLLSGFLDNDEKFSGACAKVIKSWGDRAVPAVSESALQSGRGDEQILLCARLLLDIATPGAKTAFVALGAGLKSKPRTLAKLGELAAKNREALAPELTSGMVEENYAFWALAFEFPETFKREELADLAATRPGALAPHLVLTWQHLKKENPPNAAFVSAHLDAAKAVDPRHPYALFLDAYVREKKIGAAAAPQPSAKYAAVEKAAQEKLDRIFTDYATPESMIEALCVYLGDEKTVLTDVNLADLLGRMPRSVNFGYEEKADSEQAFRKAMEKSGFTLWSPHFLYMDVIVLRRALERTQYLTRPEKLPETWKQIAAILESSGEWKNKKENYRSELQRYLHAEYDRIAALPPVTPVDLSERAEIAETYLDAVQADPFCEVAVEGLKRLAKETPEAAKEPLAKAEAVRLGR